MKKHGIFDDTEVLDLDEEMITSRQDLEEATMREIAMDTAIDPCFTIDDDTEAKKVHPVDLTADNIGNLLDAILKGWTFV